MDIEGGTSGRDEGSGLEAPDKEQQLEGREILELLREVHLVHLHFKQVLVKLGHLDGRCFSREERIEQLVEGDQLPEVFEPVPSFKRQPVGPDLLWEVSRCRTLQELVD